MTPTAIFAVDLADYLPYLPVVVGCGVGLSALVLLSLRVRKSRGFMVPVPMVRSGDTGDEDVSMANRRGTQRREGSPVRVVLSSPVFRNKTNCGYVVDRSTGGLRIALGMEITPGSALQVKAENAPDTTPWVTVIVRNCRHAGQHFELGCEFDQTPPWNVLLLFG